MQKEKLRLNLLLVLLILGLYPTCQNDLSAQQSYLSYKDLFDNAQEGKTYAIIKNPKGTSKKSYDEKESYQIKLIPPVYKTVYDTIVISPALNGNLDTSNYFIQTEVLVLREPSAEWKTAKVSKMCMEENVASPYAAICLLKTTPKYEMINRKFFPFKNILDTSNTDNIIPAEIKIYAREELVTPARLEKVDINAPLGPNEKSIKITAGTWSSWIEVTCPYGMFNDPDIRSVQNTLLKEGYALEISNSYDEQTRRALHQFQLDNMLEVGELDDATLKRLGLERQKLIHIEP